MEWILPLAALVFVLLILMRSEGESGQSTPIETRLQEALLCVEGTGNVRVVIYDDAGAIEGVLVVAEGADDLRVKLEIEKAVHTVLGVELSRIEVMDMKEE